MRKRGVKNWMSRDEGRNDQLGCCRQRRTKHTGGQNTSAVPKVVVLFTGQ